MNIRIKTANGLTGLELPCREEKIAEFCKSLGITNNSQTEVTVDYVYLNDRANALLSGRTYNLDKLNYLVKRLDSFDKSELTTFYAVAYSEKSNDIPYFKDQVVAWTEKAEKFRQDKQLYDNFSDISMKFSKLVEELEGKLYNEG